MRTSAQLRRAREELEVAEAQLQQCRQTEDEARINALVSDSVEAKREFSQAKRHCEAMERTRNAASEELRRLQALQSDLLERLPEQG